MQVGTTKDQGLYNKPSAAVHPGALAAGTLPQYNVICTSEFRLGSVQEFQSDWLSEGVYFHVQFPLTLKTLGIRTTDVCFRCIYAFNSSLFRFYTQLGRGL